MLTKSHHVLHHFAEIAYWNSLSMNELLESNSISFCSDGVNHFQLKLLGDHFLILLISHSLIFGVLSNSVWSDHVGTSHSHNGFNLSLNGLGVNI